MSLFLLKYYNKLNLKSIWKLRVDIMKENQIYVNWNQKQNKLDGKTCGLNTSPVL